MPIDTSEIKVYKAALESDATPAQNGGRMSATEVASGIVGLVFPLVSAAERAAGVEHWRKLFWTVRDAEDLTLIDARATIESGTAGDSYYLLYAGTLTDTQDQVTGRPYGYGTLASPVSSGATALTVTAESAAYDGMSPAPFQAGDILRIDARATVLDSGLWEYAEIDSISYAGAEMTIGLTAGLTNGYAAGVHVSAVIAAGDIAAGYSDKGVTGGVTYDDTTYPIAVPGLGAIYQEWTVTVTEAATGTLSIAGDTLGTLGTGAQGAELAPLNPDTGTPYFTLAADGWGGTASDGDTLTFTTYPATVPLWHRRIVPAGADSIAVEELVVALLGESA